jgi:hypothetical protein
MKQLKYILLLSLAILTVCTSCKKDDEKDKIELSDNLEQYGILGKWKLDSREIGGISSGAVLCCDTLEFKSDIQTTDLKGLFRAVGSGYERNGVFELNNLNETIELKYDNEQKSYEILISETTIVLNYVEDTIAITEWWLKQE